MKNTTIQKTTLLALLFVVSFSARALAESRSATVRVSCTILPMIEIATPSSIPSTQAMAASSASAEYQMNQKGSWVDVNTNFGNKFVTSENTLQSPDGQIKIYSVTAL